VESLADWIWTVEQLLMNAMEQAASRASGEGKGR
jgi:hypothetical protein